MELIIITLYMLAVATYAIRCGGPPERAAAALLLTTSIIDFGYHLLVGPPQFETVDPFHLIIDSVVLGGLLWVAINANRGWPLWACAAQLIVMLGHLAKLYEVRQVYRGYWVMTQVPFLLQLAVIAIGTAMHVARTRSVGPYHSWRMT